MNFFLVGVIDYLLQQMSRDAASLFLGLAVLKLGSTDSLPGKVLPANLDI